MRTEATDLIEEGGRVVGVRAKSPDGELDIRADLVVGADGRHSTLRERAGFDVEDIGAPMDVLWFRLSRRASDTAETFGHMDAGRMLVMLDRGDYWQCAYVIPKGGIDAVKAPGLDAFRDSVASCRRSCATGSARSKLGRRQAADGRGRPAAALAQPGLLCIGDAAHAMSPIGGVGINLAIQDAVAAANILAAPLKEGRVTDALLAAVQKRRTLPVRVIQWLQVQIQNNVLSAVLASSARPKPPFPARLLNWFPLLQRIPARIIGLGVRPEHVRTPAASPPRLRGEGGGVFSWLAKMKALPASPRSRSPLPPGRRDELSPMSSSALRTMPDAFASSMNSLA